MANESWSAGTMNSSPAGVFNQYVQTKELLSVGQGSSILDRGMSLLKKHQGAIMTIGTELAIYLVCVGFLVAVSGGCQ